MNDQWIWLADVCRYIDSGCSMSILESEIDKNLSNGFWGVWFQTNQMLGDTIEVALDKMMMTDQHQHNNRLLQEFYAMTQRANKPIGKYTMHLNLAASKMRLQSREALGINEEERGRLLIDRLLRCMNPKLRDRVAHIVDGKAMHERLDYWHLVKFAVEKEAEINFNEAKKVLKPKATTNFQFDRKKSNLLVNPTVWILAPVPEEEVIIEEMTPQPSEDSNSGKSCEAQPSDMPVSAADIKIAVRVAHTSEAFLGRCFRCNKVGHCFWNEECEMYDPYFLNSGWGPAKTSLNQQVPRAKNACKPTRAKTSQ